MKSGVKTWQVRGNWSQQLEHKQFPKRGNGTRCSEGRKGEKFMQSDLNLFVLFGIKFIDIK